MIVLMAITAPLSAGAEGRGACQPGLVPELKAAVEKGRCLGDVMDFGNCWEISLDHRDIVQNGFFVATGAGGSFALYSHIAGRGVQKTIARRVLGAAAVIGGLTVSTLTLLLTPTEAWEIDARSKRCNATPALKHITVNADYEAETGEDAESGGPCEPHLSYSRKVADFLRRPGFEQEKILSENSVACDFYSRLTDKIQRETEEKVELAELKCPAATESLGAHKLEFVMIPKDEKASHGPVSAQVTLRDDGMMIDALVSFPRAENDRDVVYDRRLKAQGNRPELASRELELGAGQYHFVLSDGAKGPVLEKLGMNGGGVRQVYIPAAELMDLVARHPNDSRTLELSAAYRIVKMHAYQAIKTCYPEPHPSAQPKPLAKPQKNRALPESKNKKLKK